MRQSHRSASVLVFALVGAASTSPAAELFVKPAGGGTTCVQSAPCTLATALATAAAGDTIYVGAGTYTGTGDQVVLLDTTVSLLGGWNGAASGAVVRDHVVWTSILDGQNARRVITVTGPAAAPTIDGLSIVRGNATGLTAGCTPVADDTGCGGGILVSDAGATISDNHISGNVATNAAVDPNEMAAGGGISVAYGHAVVIRDNTVSGNTASTASAALGGGIAIEHCTGCRVEGNRIVGNKGTTLDNRTAWGGGIALNESLSGTVEVIGNLVRGNLAAPTYAGSGDALHSWYVAQEISGNVLAGAGQGGPVYLGYAAGSFTGNRVEASGAAEQALTLAGGNYGRGDLLVANNVLVGGAYRSLKVWAPAEMPMTVALRHNTVVGNGAGTGVLAAGNATVVASDNIVAGHAVGAATADTAALTLDHTLFWMNDDDGLRGSDPVDGDPRFVNRAFGDFHVFPDSAAVGAGADAGVARDMDGDARPGLGGFDIGADEIAPAWFDFGTPASPVAASYTQVTPATAYTPALGFGWLPQATIAARDRLAPDDLRRDLCFTPLATFVVDVPNGRYRVTVTTGDQTAGHGQMGFFLEGVQMASVSTAAAEFKTLTWDVSVTDGQLTLLLDDLGGADPNVVINALIVLRAPAIGLDLGTPSSPVEGGFARVTPASRYSPTAGAGWLGGTVQARDRGVGSALLRDFNFTPRAYFSLYLMDGIYDLSLTYGDATGAHDNMSVAFQAQGAGSLSTTANQFVTRTYPVTVVNNVLRAYLTDSGGKDPNVVLNAVQVGPRPQPRFDFGTPTSPVETGYVQVTPATTYETWRGYGFKPGTLAARDRGTVNLLARDFVFATQLEFAVDVLDGVYDVAITFSDATAVHDMMEVSVEGSVVETVSLPVPGAAYTPIYRVRVTGGQLNVSIADRGGRDANVVINGLEIR